MSMDHVIKILDIKHIAEDGSILWQAENLTNMLHITGEEYILRAIFMGGPSNSYIPTYYYFGLDNRTTLAATDTLVTVGLTEPATYGYSRVAVNSTAQFTVSVALSTHNVATGPIVTYRAVGGTWGPVRNLFLSTTSDNSGYLVASCALLAPITVTAGQQISARMGLGLKDCP